MKKRVGLIGFQIASLVRDIAFFIEQQDSDVSTYVIQPNSFLQDAIVSEDEFLVCVSKDMMLRDEIIRHLVNRRCRRYTFIHNSAVIADNVSIGEGSWIGPFCTLPSDSVIGSDCIMAPYCMVSHLSTVGSGTVMQPHSTIAGSTTVGRCCKLNVRAVVLDHLTLCDFIEVGAASMVTKNLNQPGYYVGLPARRVA